MQLLDFAGVLNDFFRRDLLETSDYLKDDTLVVRCCVGVVIYAEEEPHPQFGHSLGNLAGSGSRNDVNFQVDGEEYAAEELK